MKLTASQLKSLKSKISHIVGECDCPATSSTCAYWKTVDKGGPEWRTDLILKEIKKL